jgi:DsbE subfamily thiol:disulfide oxidoreductase
MRQKKHLVWGIVGLVALLSIAWLGMATGNGVAPTGTAVGDRVPDFTLADLNSQQYQLEAIISKNQVTLVNFWATWCGPCRGEIPELIRFYSQYSSQKVALLAINLQEKPAEVRKFAKKAGMNFPVLTDTTGRVGELYKVYAIPTTYIVDSKGIIRHVIEGSTSLRVLQAKIQTILKEQ